MVHGAWYQYRDAAMLHCSTPGVTLGVIRYAILTLASTHQETKESAWELPAEDPSNLTP